VDFIVVVSERPPTSRIADIIGEFPIGERRVVTRAFPRMYSAVAMDRSLQSYFARLREIEAEQVSEIKKLNPFVAPFQLGVQIPLVGLVWNTWKVTVATMLGGVGLDVGDDEQEQ
jgi:hypothetical protein